MSAKRNDTKRYRAALGSGHSNAFRGAWLAELPEGEPQIALAGGPAPEPKLGPVSDELRLIAEQVAVAGARWRRRRSRQRGPSARPRGPRSRGHGRRVSTPCPSRPRIRRSIGRSRRSIGGVAGSGQRWSSSRSSTATSACRRPCGTRPPRRRCHRVRGYRRSAARDRRPCRAGPDRDGARPCVHWARLLAGRPTPAPGDRPAAPGAWLAASDRRRGGASGPARRGDRRRSGPRSRRGLRERPVTASRRSSRIGAMTRGATLGSRCRSCSSRS